MRPSSVSPPLRWSRGRIKCEGGGKTEREIKIGDHVRGTAGSSNMFTGPDLFDAVVLDIWEDGQVLIQIVRHGLYSRDEGAILGVDEDEIELLDQQKSR